MERQTYLFTEMSLSHKVFGKLYFEEYLKETTPESREAYMMWLMFDTAIQSYHSTPDKDKPFFLIDNVTTMSRRR